MENMPQTIAESYDDIPDMSSSSVKAVKKAPGAFLTISEVADKLDVQQHVLRFWESKFSQLKPLKRGGGRRYYRPEDVALLKVIHKLLYSDKYTIKGAQNLLKGHSKMQILQNFVANSNQSAAVAPAASNDANTNTVVPMTKPVSVSGLSASQKELLKETIQDLRKLRSMVESQ